MKKSQVTVFIILVLVIIIVLSIILYNSNKTKVREFTATEDINLKEITPIQIYIEEAMQQLLLEGYFLIGKQGGRIYEDTWPDCLEENESYEHENRMCLQKGYYDYSFPKYLEESPYVYKRVAIGINHSRVDDGFSVTYSSDEPLSQPFAYPHVGKRRQINYLYGIEQPLASISKEAGEPSIEMQLARWIENHILELIDYDDMKKRGYEFIIPPNLPNVTVDINEKYITAKMLYPLKVEKSGLFYTPFEYYTEIRSDFQVFYSYIHNVIREDISTKSHILRQRLFDANNNQIGGVSVHESDPPNFMYDLINVTINTIDYTKEYNNEQDLFRFYFIRENRPADAGTVKLTPEYFYVGQTATWFCFNMKTSESPFDPDEDDDFSKDPFPWVNPPWYFWYSRGDHLETHPIPKTDNCKNAPPVDTMDYAVDDLQLHYDPYSDGWGALFMDKLPACGNSDDDVSTTGTLGDVGDLIILKTSDQQEFVAGGRVQAPTRYPDPPILEDGTGRLNDVMVWRPVKCTPGVDGSYPGCCSGGYWLFDDRPLDEPYEEVCLETCETTEDRGISPDIQCECVELKCAYKVRMYYHCNHLGMKVVYPDYEKIDDFRDCNIDRCTYP